MVKEVEGQFEVDGVSLYTKTWLPDSDESTPTVAKLIFFHGFSDHVNRYYDFFPTLARAGIAVYGLDQRGWGRSVRKPSDKGLTGPTTQVLSDMVAFINHVLSSGPSSDDADAHVVPVFVMGHSMGGGQVLTLLSTPAYTARLAGQGGQGLGRIRGWLLEGPFLGFDPRDRPSWLKLHGGKLAGRVLPKFQLVNPIPVEWLTRDEAAQRSIREDPLCHDTGTLEGLAGFMDRTAALAEGRLRLDTAGAAGTAGDGNGVRSLWVGHGDHDRTAWFEACKGWYDAYATGVEDRSFRVYEGYLHQLHAEVGREVFYGDVRDWILERCEGGGNNNNNKKREGPDVANEAEKTAAATTTLSSEEGASAQQAEGESGGKLDSKL